MNGSKKSKIERMKLFGQSIKLSYVVLICRAYCLKKIELTCANTQGTSRYLSTSPTLSIKELTAFAFFHYNQNLVTSNQAKFQDLLIPINKQNFKKYLFILSFVFYHNGKQNLVFLALIQKRRGPPSSSLFVLNCKKTFSLAEMKDIF